ncbi:MAG: 23S rRNA (guanosine(2251)-2'-O)-methyltransferase RlmB [Candidatus Latescibacterota bacterium]
MDQVEREIIFGRYPVLEALRAGRSCLRLHIARGSRGPAVDEIFALARQQRVPYAVEERQALDRLADGAHQGMVAVLAARAYADYEELLARCAAPAGFVVYLDSIQDPHNLGAILRTAHASGADGLVVPSRGAAGLTPAAVKAAAGAAEHLPVCRVTNLPKSLQQARQAGLWLFGLHAQGPTDYTQADYAGPCGIVVGGEGSGLRRLVSEGCDQLVRIPSARPGIGSLNASVAAGLVLYEVLRQRRESRSTASPTAKSGGHGHPQPPGPGAPRAHRCGGPPAGG